MPPAKRGEGEEAEEEAEQEGDGQAGAAADPEAAAATRAEMQRLLEEYYRLDYEDVVGGIPTRFRWVGATAGAREAERAHRALPSCSSSSACGWRRTARHLA
jgi:hypothetical protein